MKILYQGNEGAYSQLAAEEIFPRTELIACKTFEDCFKKCVNDENLRAIIPIENSIAGRVADIQYLMNKYKLQINNLKYVRSHSQAISQCQKLINEYKLEPIIAADTAGSAKYISENSLKDEAAIASSLAAKKYNLEILKKNIEDDEKNVTRFLFMGKKIEHPEFKNNENFITSCIFKVKDKPAALYKCLGGFATNDISLSKLESFSDQSSFEQYLFLCDIVGHIEDPKVQKSLEELGFHTISLEILGVYKASTFRNL